MQSPYYLEKKFLYKKKLENLNVNLFIWENEVLIKNNWKLSNINSFMYMGERCSYENRWKITKVNSSLFSWKVGNGLGISWKENDEIPYKTTEPRSYQ